MAFHSENCYDLLAGETVVPVAYSLTLEWLCLGHKSQLHFGSISFAILGDIGRKLTYIHGLKSKMYFSFYHLRYLSP